MLTACNKCLIESTMYQSPEAIKMFMEFVETTDIPCKYCGQPSSVLLADMFEILDRGGLRRQDEKSNQKT